METSKSAKFNDGLRVLRLIDASVQCGYCKFFGIEWAFRIQ